MEKSYDEVSLKDFANLKDKDVFERSEIFQDYLEYLRSKDQLNYRIRCTHGSEPFARIIYPKTGKEKHAISFISNDYLNLTKDPEVIEAGRKTMEKYGSGA